MAYLHPKLRRVICDGFMCNEHHKCIAKLKYELNEFEKKQKLPDPIANKILQSNLWDLAGK